jgi:pimeloyl-ACP methyl ester carboxylesterase
MMATSGLAQLAYDVTGGSQGGNDVLLVHAGVTDRRSWRPLVEVLADRHRCVSYDARGFGETTYEKQDGWSPVDDAVAVLDAAGVDEAVVVGASMGGGTSIELALARPDLVSALVLIGTAVGGAPYPDLTDSQTIDLDARVDAAEEAEDWGELNRLEAWMWLDGPTSPEGRVSGPTRDLFLEMNGIALRAADPGDKIKRDDAWQHVEAIDVPTLILVGRLDVEDMQAVDEQLAAQLPDARLVQLDGVAHLPHFEGDPTTLREISAFIDGLSGT